MKITKPDASSRAAAASASSNSAIDSTSISTGTPAGVGAGRETGSSATPRVRSGRGSLSATNNAPEKGCTFRLVAPLYDIAGKETTELEVITDAELSAD